MIEPLLVAFEIKWMEMVELAYLEGYEYVLNDDDEYERVAIYIPVEDVDTNSPETNSTTNETTDAGDTNNQTNNNSGDSTNNNTTNNTTSTNNQTNNNSSTNNNSTNTNTNNQTNNNTTTNNTSNNPPATGGNTSSGSGSGSGNNTGNTPPPNPTPPTPEPTPQRPVDILDQSHIMSTLRAYGQNNRGATMVSWEDAQRSLGYAPPITSAIWGSNVTNQLMIEEVQQRMRNAIGEGSYFHLSWSAQADGNVVITLHR